MSGTTKLNLLIVCLAVAAAGNQAIAVTPAATGKAIQPTPQVLVVPPEAIPALIQKQIQQQIQLHQQIQKQMPPILVPKGFPVPLGPPAWALERLPLMPLPQVVPLELKRGPVDPGSLRVDKRAVPDGAGGQYLIEERTWTSLGVPHREIVETHGLPGQQPVTAAPQTLPKTDVQPQTLPQPVPDTNQQTDALPQPVLDTADQPATQPAAPLPTTDAEGTLKQPEPDVAEPVADQPAAKVELVDVTPIEPAQTEQSAAAAVTTPAPVQTPARVVGVGVSVDSTRGTQVYKYSQGATGQVIEKTIQSGPAAPGTVTGIGVSVDSEKGTRVYRYQGAPATTPQ